MPHGFSALRRARRKKEREATAQKELLIVFVLLVSSLPCPVWHDRTWGRDLSSFSLKREPTVAIDFLSEPESLSFLGLLCSVAETYWAYGAGICNCTGPSFPEAQVSMISGAALHRKGYLQPRSLHSPTIATAHRAC